MKTYWQEVVDFINKKEIGDTVTRYELKQLRFKGSENTTDYIRLILTGTGYLSKTRNGGEFIVEKHVPETMTLTSMRNLYNFEVINK